MKKVLILHGWEGSDEPHWQDWIARELAVSNCIVAFIQLSNNTQPDREEWMKESLDVIRELSPDVVLCHSLGNILWFHIAPFVEKEVEKLMLCAIPQDLGYIRELRSFFPVDIPSDLKAKKVLMVASDNDPYMNIQDAVELSRKLNVRMKIVPNAGHINASSGFGPWPWAKEWVFE